jgi:ankyrin repeat protein
VKSLITNFKKALYAFVFIGYSLSFAGSYDDFFKAIERDDASTVGQLVARGFDVNIAGPAGLQGLLLAIQAPSPKVLAVLLEAPGLQAEQRNPNDENALMLAALAGMREVCERLIARDADVNKPGWTPLHYAATAGRADIVKLLLDHYAYIDAESPNLTTPLMMAAMYGNPATVSMLLDAGADPYLRNMRGLSALDFAEAAERDSAYKLIAQRLQEQSSK